MIKIKSYSKADKEDLENIINNIEGGDVKKFAIVWFDPNADIACYHHPKMKPKDLLWLSECLRHCAIKDYVCDNKSDDNEK